MAAARLLATGFGPFPGAPENPTEALMRALATSTPEAFGASVFDAIVLPTDYRRSWDMLETAYERFAPDVVVHFGVNGRAEAIHIETVARNRVDLGKPDAAGYAPPSGRAHEAGPERMATALPAERMLLALSRTGIAAVLSDDAGDYVCNATFYRSLAAAPTSRRVGFIHVPPSHHLRPDALHAAATCLLSAAVAG